jgi:hypothetical protein
LDRTTFEVLENVLDLNGDPIKRQQTAFNPFEVPEPKKMQA